MDEEHIHPLDAHHQLTLSATHVLVHNHINPAHYGNILPIVSLFLEFCWANEFICLILKLL
jgi:hypothetical protein